MNLPYSTFPDNNNREIFDERAVNAAFDVNENLDDFDLENLLYACTAGGELGRASTAYFNRYIEQNAECRAHAVRILARMEARQIGRV